jgi:methionyl-tRNA formyltransferase
MVTAPALRIVFFGTPTFAVPTLEALLASRHDVVGVVSQPDRPRGRGQKLEPTPVKAAALAAGLAVLQPERLKTPEFMDALAGMRADLAVVAAYGKIIAESVIAIPRLGMINVHASLLPKYRGAAPIQRAVLAGDRETGVTIMRIVKELDAGAMFAAMAVPIGPDDTSEDVERALAARGGALLVEVVDRMAEGTAHEQPQDETKATYAPKIVREEGAIDWSRPARAIHDQVRGLTPWPRAWTHAEGARLILTRTSPEASAADAAPGTVLEAAGDRLVVRAGEGALRILGLQPEGRRAMSAREYLAGRPLTPGTRLS